MTMPDDKIKHLEKLFEELDTDRKDECVNLLGKKVYTVDEVSELLGVHAETVRRAIRAGRLRAFRVGGTVRGALRITHDELDRFMGIQPPPSQA